MIQGGCPDGTGMGGPATLSKANFLRTTLKTTWHILLAFCLWQELCTRTLGSQFFIMHETSPHLDGAYAAFGKVIEGMDVVNKIAETRTDYSDRPLEKQEISSMTVETFGVDYPEPEKC